jgi:type II secretory pathway component PulK
MLPTRQRERGIALLVVLFVLLLSTILALEIKSSAALHMRLAKTKRDDFLMRQAMRGHLEVLKQVLLADREKNENETLDDLWMDTKYTSLQELPEEMEETEEAEEPEPTSSEDSEVTARVEDEARKFNLHNLVVESDALRAHWEEVFLRLVVLYREEYDQEYRVSRSDAEALLRNLKEWLKRPDSDQEVPRPATTDEKKILITPDELLMVEGFTREILYDVPLPEDDRTEETGAEVPGLCRFLTLWSTGPVNLNTAEPALVYAMFTDGDRDLAERFLEWRNQDSDETAGEGQTADDKPLRNSLKLLQDLSKVDGIDSAALLKNTLNDQTLTTKSDVFSIHLFAESPDGIARQERWVISRNAVGFTTLLYEERNDPKAEDEEEIEGIR